MPDLRALHLKWYAPVLTLARRMLADTDEAEEAAQEVFIDAWRRLSCYDAARGTEWAWLRKMTHSRCLDRLRATRRRQLLGRRAHREPVALPEQVHEEGEAAALLSRLPDAQRRLIELSVIEGRTHREISSLAGLPLGTVKSRIRLGLRRLAEQMEAEEPADLSAAPEAGRGRG